MSRSSIIPLLLAGQCVGAALAIHSAEGQAGAKGGEDFIEALGLKEMTVGPMRVFHGTSLDGKVDGLRNLFEKMARQFSDRQREIEKLRLQSDAVIQELNRLVGWAPDREFLQTQESLFSSFLTNSFGQLLLQDSRIFVVPPAETKAYLRGGGTIPGISYDPLTDQAQVEFVRGWNSAAQAKRESGLFVLPADDLPQIAKYLEAIQAMLPGGPALALHELVEVTILKRLKPPDPTFRWFSDGFANAISEVLLRKMVSPEAAKAFAGINAVAPYDDLKSSLLLRYWLGKDYCVQTSLESQSRLNQARYNFATLEARRVLEKHGEMALKKTLDLALAEPHENKDAITLSERLLKCLERATGEDIEARFRLYEPFESRSEGVRHYQDALTAADAKSDHEAALVAILRSIELRTADAGAVPFDLYREAALRLHSLGRLDECLTVFEDCIKIGGNSPELLRQIRREFVQMAWVAGRPERAESAAKDLLVSDAHDVRGLSIRMELLSRAGNYAEAHRAADQILEQASSQEALYSSLAQFAIAVWHLQGQGVPKDLKQARDGFARAATNGHAVAARNLANLWLKGEGGPRDQAKALEWLEKAAASDHIPAQHLMGAMYATGQGVDRDMTQAFGWFQKAARQGHVEAQLTIGKLYFSGEGVGKDAEQALAWLEKAALGRNAEAQWLLAGSYWFGEVVPKDIVTAYKWSSLAAESGYPEAKKYHPAVVAEMTVLELAEGARELVKLRKQIEPDQPDSNQNQSVK